MATPKTTNTLSDQAIAELRRDHAKLKYDVAELRAAVRMRSDATNPAQVGRLFKNSTGETIPAFGVMAVTDASRAIQEPYLKVAKPSTTFRRTYVVNGDLAIADGSFGYCHERGTVQVLYDSGTPALGEGWGPKPGQWTLSKFYPATATVAGITDSSARVMLAEWKQITEFWGKVNGNITHGGTGNISLWAGVFGSESDTGIDINGVGCPSGNMTLNDKANGGWMNGQPEIYPREC
jgi:hypothetical protein